jgi:diadenosine tetraphosphate (Ap4A) HIT family hydrolase
MALPENLSETYIRDHCPHCDPATDAFTDLLEETKYFRIVCDYHSIIEGHILIIPKRHLSCVGEYPKELSEEFIGHYETVSAFVKKNYGSVSTFEHGKIGQTVFHSHVHLLPYKGDPLTIVPEGKIHLVALPSFVELQRLYEHYGRYLFFSIGDLAWVADPSLAAPRFFRDRFASTLGRPERGNWKNMHIDTQLMDSARKDNEKVKALWKRDHAH